MLILFTFRGKLSFSCRIRDLTASLLPASWYRQSSIYNLKFISNCYLSSSVQFLSSHKCHYNCDVPSTLGLLQNILGIIRIPDCVLSAISNKKSRDKKKYGYASLNFMKRVWGGSLQYQVNRKQGKTSQSHVWQDREWNLIQTTGLSTKMLCMSSSALRSDPTFNLWRSKWPLQRPKDLTSAGWVE